MQWTKIVTGLVVFSCLVACGKRPHKYAAPPAPADPAPRAPKCATENDQTIDPAHAVQRKTVDLRRQRQRIIRRGCNQKLESDGMEKTIYPETDLIITPIMVKDKRLTGSAYNRTTCKGEGMGIGKLFTALVSPFQTWFESDKSQIKLVIDTSPVEDHMHVRRGRDNYIDYEFRKCLDKSRPEGVSCVKSEVVERGTLVLTVNYSELPDIETPREIVDCKEDQKKP